MEDYISCSYRGFHLKVLRKFNDHEFFNVCCQVPSNGKSGFRRVPSSGLALVYCFEYKDQHFLHKSFLRRNWKEPIKNVFRQSRAERAFKGHLLLQKNGLCTPRVVLVGKKGSHNFVVWDAIQNGQDLYQFFQESPTSQFSKEKIILRRTAILELGHMVGRMHALGISHGDLRWGNVFADTSNPFRLRFILIDNERTIQYRRLPDRKRLTNLVQLHMFDGSILTNRDRMRFFQAYLTENPELIPRRKLWIRRILNKTAKRLGRKARHCTDRGEPSRS